MATQVEEQWRERGVSSALIDGALGLIGDTPAQVISRCKLSGGYIVRHPEYRRMVPEQYHALLQPMSLPQA